MRNLRHGLTAPASTADHDTAEWLCSYLQANGPCSVGKLAQVAGSAGHLGVQRRDGYWTKFGRLARARSVVPDLGRGLAIEENLDGALIVWQLRSIGDRS